MATSYPGGIDAFINPGPTDFEDDSDVYHDEQHADANDAIEAIETELGVNPSGAYSTVGERLDNASIWTPVGTPVWSDEFNGAIDVNWVRADASGTAGRVVWTQSNGCLSARHDGTVDGSNGHYLLYPLASAGGDWAVGDAIETATNMVHYNWAVAHIMGNVGLSNGVTHGTSNTVVNQWYASTDTGDHKIRAVSNPLMTADGATAASVITQNGGFYYRRLVYTAANTWRADFSCDGVSWIPTTPNPLSYTVTPTHLCLGLHMWTGAYPSIVTFYYIRRYSGVS